MKKTCLALLLLAFTFTELSAQTDKSVKRYKPTVLVEFFTSEGCSSCPAADEFAQSIKKISDSNNMYVYTIDWHVDLWDKSGWKDPFSDSTYSARQLQLALKNNQKAMFTPMAFVNGKGALPGAARGEVGKLIEQFVDNPASHFLLYSATWSPEQKQLLLEYEIKGPPDSCDLFFVWVEKEIINKVTAGENKDKVLSHHNVVRKVQMETRGSEFGTVVMPFGTDQIDFSKYMVFGFLQHKRTFQVLAVQPLIFNTKKAQE